MTTYRGIIRIVAMEGRRHGDDTGHESNVPTLRSQLGTPKEGEATYLSQPEVPFGIVGQAPLMPLPAKPFEINERSQRRFWRHVRKTDTCWFWTGSQNGNGYGRFRVGERLVVAHRFSFVLTHGAIPADRYIDHLCRNRQCVCPEHMELVTHRVNTLRGVSPSAIHAAKTSCSRGHLFTAKSTYNHPAGNRTCRECRRIWKGDYRRRNIAAGHHRDSAGVLVRRNG